jgi:hypothetical protein
MEQSKSFVELMRTFDLAQHVRPCLAQRPVVPCEVPRPSSVPSEEGKSLHGSQPHDVAAAAWIAARCDSEHVTVVLTQCIAVACA